MLLPLATSIYASAKISVSWAIAGVIKVVPKIRLRANEMALILLFFKGMAILKSCVVIVRRGHCLLCIVLGTINSLSV